jgi:hypothetical protein
MVYPSDRDEAWVELRVFLPTSDHNSFRCHITEVPASSLWRIFSDYREDPENALLLYFNWEAPRAAKPLPKPTSQPNLIDQSELL